MSSAHSPVKAATTTACELALVAVAIWLLRGYVWPTLSNVEVATLQARLDPRLFVRDFAVQEALQFSPRFYYNELILLPARAGLPLAWAFVGWHLVALVALVGGLCSLAQTLGMGFLAAAALGVWLLTVSVGTLGGVYFYTHAPVPAVWAGAAVMCGASQAVRGRREAAYAWFGLAVLLQFLVGFYAGLLALPVLQKATGRQRLSALAWWALGLALVYVPMRLSGGTDSGFVDNRVFVEIYAQLRLPHHLVPSAWGWAVWIQAVVFYAGAGLFLVRTSTGRPELERRLLWFTLGVLACALVLNYVFIEQFPLALVAKLQPARITPLAQGVILVLLATRVQAYLARKDWLSAVLLILIPLSLFPGLLLVLAALLSSPEGPEQKAGWPSLALAAAVVMAFQPFEGSFSARSLRYGIYAAILAAQCLPFWLRRRPLALHLTTILAVAGAGLCALASLRSDWPRFLSQRFTVDAPPSDPPAVIGCRFGKTSPVDALVLLPPTGETWTFKLYAKRAVVVDDKNSPFTERGLLEWKERMDTILGRPFGSNTDANTAWRARTPDELRSVAQHYGAHYILTRDAWHPVMFGRRIDQEQGWSLWQLP